MIDFLYTLIISPIVQILEITFVFSQWLFLNHTGITVIVLSVVVSVLCLPIYLVAERWQERERDKTARMKPALDRIRSVFKGDERFMVLNTYYRQEHYHPFFALRGTFGVLFQIPFFIAAYSWLSHLEALKGASFLFIQDLSKPDGLLSFGGGGNILPLLMTLINCAAGAVYTKGHPLKDKIQLYGMAALFLILLYHSPAALVLYWTTNNIFSLLKNIYLKLPFKNKQIILYSTFSMLMIFLIYFLLTVLKSHTTFRYGFSLVCGVLLIGCWTAFAFKKRIAGLWEKAPEIAITNAERLRLVVVSCAALWAFTGLFLPSTLIAASPQEFSFIDEYTTPLFFIYHTALQALGICVFWPCCLYALFSKTVQKYFAVLYAGFVLIAIGNVFFFQGNYGLISIMLGFERLVEHRTTETVVNMLVVLAFFGITGFLLYKRLAGKLTVFYALCAAALTGLSAAQSVSIQRAYLDLAEYYKPKTEGETTIEPIFHLSKTGKNVVVIMLDMGANSFIPAIFEESPELKDIYSGFVYYPNTVTFNGYTILGVPPIFGGYESTPLEINKRSDISLLRKHNEALLMMPRIFSEAGYSVTVTDPPYVNFNWIANTSIYDHLPGVKAYITDSQYTKLWMKEHNFYLPSVSTLLKRNIIWYSFLRVSPLALRSGLYMSGNWCAPIKSSNIRQTLNGYSVLDYLPQLTDFTPSAENTALFLVNNTAHEHSFMQAPEYRPSLYVTNYGTSPFGKISMYHVNAASIKRLADWFVYLKENDVYNNTRIILVADHGILYVNYTLKGSKLPFPVEQFNPLLMVKDFDAQGAMTTDRTFMTNADVPHIALAGLILNPVNPYTGNAITAELKQQPLYIVIGRRKGIDGKHTTTLKLNDNENYYVYGDVLNDTSWTRADHKLKN